MAFSPPNSEAFAKFIEHCVSVKHMTYMDAVIEFCASRDIDPEAIVPFLNDKIRTALAEEGRNLHLLKLKRRTLDDA